MREFESRDQPNRGTNTLSGASLAVAKCTKCIQVGEPGGSSEYTAIFYATVASAEVLELSATAGPIGKTNSPPGSETSGVNRAWGATPPG